MSIPTKGETYAKLMEHLRYAQEDSAMLAHLNGAEGDSGGRLLASGWLHIFEGLKRMQEQVTVLATRGLQ